MAKGVPERISFQDLITKGIKPTMVVIVNAVWLSSVLKKDNPQLISIKVLSNASGKYSRRRDSVATFFCPAVVWVFTRLNPVAITAFWTRERTSARASTTNFSVVNSTFTFSTPSSPLIAFSIFRAQLGQSIPLTCQLKRWVPLTIVVSSRSLSSSASSA